MTRLVIIGALAALAGCGVTFQQPAPRPPPVSGVATGSTPTGSTVGDGSIPGASRPAENQASTVLLEQSRSATARGDHQAAALSIERALAIDPNNAALWIELAEIRRRQGDRDQADSLARKALTLAGNDRSIVERAQQLTGR